MNSVEKDVDNPSVAPERPSYFESRDASTPVTLTQLFAAPEASPIISRHTYVRTPTSMGYTRAGTGDSAPLPNHLYNRGLLSGKHSDITIHAFNNSYALHRLLLDRAPFFSSALSEPWFESSSQEMTLHPEEVDSNITQAAFELALKRLYGCQVTAEEDREAIGLFATGCWLEMPDLIEASVNSILRQLATVKLGSMIKLVTTSYYGKHGDRILASAKAMLCREGWEMPLRYWDSVSGEIAREIIGEDGFFVAGEWERFLLAKKVLDRKLKSQATEAGLFDSNGRPKPPPVNPAILSAIRFDYLNQRASAIGQVPEAWEPWLALYTSPEISPLMILLNEGIHYVHLTFEQLQRIRLQSDVLGMPLMPDKVINDALWMQMELRQRIVNAPELNLDLGLSRSAEEETTDDATQSKLALTKKGKERDADLVILGDEEDWDETKPQKEGGLQARKFWIPSVDSTSVMGGNPDATMYSISNNTRPFISRQSASIDPVDVQWASDFTASAHERPTSRERSDSSPPSSFTSYPPFRFAAEFPNPRNLKEKKRVYSRTVWYAGSLWNLYIQKVETSKNTQLGVYLHRAKDKEGQEEPYQHTGSVDERIGQVELLLRRNLNRRQSRPDVPDEDDTSVSIPAADAPTPEPQSRTATITNLLRGNTTTSSTSAEALTKSSQTPTTPANHTLAPHQQTHTGNSDSDNDDATYNSRDFSNNNKLHSSIPTIPTYVDGRPTIKTYFKIYSPSKGGRMLSVYESAPDLFNFSQSWGWKSSTMVLDDGLGVGGFDTRGGDIGGNTSGGRCKDGRLRFMVVIGNV